LPFRIGFIETKIQKPPKGYKNPALEASYRYFPVIPFHGGLQKVKGKVDGFTELRKETLSKYCSYEN